MSVAEVPLYAAAAFGAVAVDKLFREPLALGSEIKVVVKNDQSDEYWHTHVNKQVADKTFGGHHDPFSGFTMDSSGRVIPYDYLSLFQKILPQVSMDEIPDLIADRQSGIKRLRTRLATVTTRYHTDIFFLILLLWSHDDEIEASRKAKHGIYEANKQLLPLSQIVLTKKTLIPYEEMVECEHLNLNRKEITDNDCIAIAHIVKHNKKLKSLSLGFNHVGDMGAATIAGGLQDNMTLECLHLYSNKIGDQGACEIIITVPSMARLRVLDLGGNRMGNKGPRFAKLVADIIQDDAPMLPALELVNLENCRLRPVGARLLAEGLEEAHDRGCTIKRCLLTGNMLPDEVIKELNDLHIASLDVTPRPNVASKLCKSVVALTQALLKALLHKAQNSKLPKKKYQNMELLMADPVKQTAFRDRMTAEFERVQMSHINSCLEFEIKKLKVPENRGLKVEECVALTEALIISYEKVMEGLIMRLPEAFLGQLLSVLPDKAPWKKQVELELFGVMADKREEWKESIGPGLRKLFKLLVREADKHAHNMHEKMDLDISGNVSYTEFGDNFVEGMHEMLHLSSLVYMSTSPLTRVKKHIPKLNAPEEKGFDLYDFFENMYDPSKWNQAQRAAQPEAPNPETPHHGEMYRSLDKHHVNHHAVHRRQSSFTGVVTPRH